MKGLRDFRVIVFDFDDTLVQTKASKWDAIKETARRYYALELTDGQIARFWGKPFQVMLEGAMGYVDTFEVLKKRYFRVTQEFPMVAYEGAVEALHQLVRDFLVGVLTASERELTWNDLKRLHFPVTDMFYIQTAEDTNVHKPDPRVFDPTIVRLKEENVDPARVLYVGDAGRDYEAAAGAGLQFLGIAHANESMRVFEDLGVDYVVSFAELIAKLAE